MNLESLTIKNYRALRDVTIPLSQFVCLTGENNAGKSSFLQAMALFLSGSSLPETNFFDAKQEITIAVGFTHVSSADLALLAEEHRLKIEPLVKDGNLKFVRRWGIDGKSQLGYYGRVPRDIRFQQDIIDAMLKGKKGSAVRAEVVKAFPELDGKLSSTITQTAAKDAIRELADAQPDSEKDEQFIALPTGGGFSVSAMLPEAIYIPAVKDLKDETKTTETSSFGKILKIIMDRIEPLLAQEKALFEKLTERITRVPNHEGVLEDRRLHEIRDIEKTMQTFLQESFSTVSLQLEIPPPSISSVLSTAKILANDGIQGPLDLKGDGLRRAVVFSILRTYVELAAQQEMINAKKKANQPESEQSDSPSAAAELASPVKTKTRSYILLFEEPELFLHPDAQRILFDALRVFSNDHHVVVTTHSPSFLGPQATATFVRLSKHTAEGVSKPFTQAKPVDLKGLIPKDEFQIICFENNAAAFFSRRVVLVEGDSDLIVFPHLAQLLNPNWTCLKNSVSFTRVNGKGNIPRYRRFFERFDVPTFVIADLDVIAEGLLELDLGEPVRLAREYLLNAITTHLATQEPPLPSADDAKEAQANRSVRALWKNVRDAHKAFEADPQCFGRLDKAVEEFFAWEKKHAIRDALRKPPTDRIGQLKAHLLELLRGYSIFILSNGVIEDYYPTNISGSDKPTRARAFCENVTSQEQALKLCPELSLPGEGVKKSEFEVIFGEIFGRN